MIENKGNLLNNQTINLLKLKLNSLYGISSKYDVSNCHYVFNLLKGVRKMEDKTMKTPQPTKAGLIAVLETIKADTICGAYEDMTIDERLYVIKKVLDMIERLQK